MVNKKPKKREALLAKRIYSQNFVVAYDFIDKDFGVFFGISAKSAKPLRRNSIKRIFRNIVREELGVKIKSGVKLSLCLISKKGVKLNNAMLCIKEELRGLVQKLNNKIG